MSSNVKRLKKGFDIKISGKPSATLVSEFSSKTFAVKPTDFKGIAPIPKMEVALGKTVKAGDVLFHDKQSPSIKYCSPVSGKLIAINRGAKRAVTEVVIQADSKIKFKKLSFGSLHDLDASQIIEALMGSGIWPSIISRPFGVVADPKTQPRDIFISGFSTSPLAADWNYVCAGERDAFQVGVDALRKLTSGKVHLGLNADKVPADTFNHVNGVQVNWFSGAHPSGNVGVQIHHTAPIAKGQTVWTLNPMDVITIGRLFRDEQYNTERLVALGGSSVTKTGYHKTYLGASIKEIIDGNTEEHVRYIDGDVLTGSQVSLDGFIGSRSNLISVIAEGDQYELFGWLIPSYPRPTASKSFPGFIYSEPEYAVNTNTNGEERAFVVSGQYEKVLPMDIYPVHLLKAAMVEDFDQLEGLGIYEVLEEDLALCEFVCTSKVPVQKILRDGLDFMRSQI